MSRRALRASGATYGAAWALVLALACVPSPARTQETPGALERRVKAAFLYKFASYVTWPRASFPTLDTPVRIGVVGDDSLAADLTEMVAGHTVEGRAVTAVKLAPGDSLEAVHVLFLARSQQSRLGSLIHGLGHHPTLVVTESEDGLTQGSMIDFVLVEGRVRFRISVPAAQRCGLDLSSRLLAVALSVVRS